MTTVLDVVFALQTKFDLATKNVAVILDIIVYEQNNFNKLPNLLTDNSCNEAKFDYKNLNIPICSLGL